MSDYNLIFLDSWCGFRTVRGMKSVCSARSATAPWSTAATTGTASSSAGSTTRGRQDIICFMFIKWFQSLNMNLSPRASAAAATCSARICCSVFTIWISNDPKLKQFASNKFHPSWRHYNITTFHLDTDALIADTWYNHSSIIAMGWEEGRVN